MTTVHTGQDHDKIQTISQQYHITGVLVATCAYLSIQVICQKKIKNLKMILFMGRKVWTQAVINVSLINSV